jgi:hypothetical protein
VLGFGWYRDVTAVRAASGTPRYWGTRLEPEAEARSQALLALAAGSWHALATPSGEHAGGSHEPSAPALAPVRALLEAGVRAGALQRAFGWVRLRPGLSPDAREAFLRSLLPPRALERAHAVAALAFKLRKDVQPELVELDRAHRALAGDDHG